MLGILGLGSYSTLHYVQRLNHEYQKLNGGFSTYPFILYNVDFDLINPYLPNQFEKLKPVVKQKVEELNALGVTKILIPNITLHETIDKIDFTEEIKNKFVHPKEGLASKIDKKEVIVLGTRYTMNSNYILENCDNNSIKITEDELQIIDDLRTKVYKNGVEEKHINLMKALLDSYPSATFIIACTELSLIVSKLESCENRIDLVENQIMACI